jgi:hypothetical protein
MTAPTSTPATTPAPASTAASTTAKKPPLTTTQVQENPLLLLESFTTTDLQSAIADANAQTPPDVAASTCYNAILKTIQSLETQTPTSGPVGAFSSLQKARDIKAFALSLLSPTGPMAELNIACAPLLMDAEATLTGLGIVAGAIVNPVGGAAAAVGLPAALAAMLAVLPK